MKAKKTTKTLMVGIMVLSLLTPYQPVLASSPSSPVMKINDDGNGDASTNRYLDYKLLDGAKELVEPSPVLPAGINQKTMKLKINHKAGELDGQNAKIRYRVTGAGGKEYKRGTILTGTVGTSVFPSVRLDDSFEADVTFIRGETVCEESEICLPAEQGNYNLSVDLVFDAEDGNEQVFSSLSKTIYVTGDVAYKQTDETDYTKVQGDFQYDLYRKTANGAYESFSEVTAQELDGTQPVSLYIEGYYQPDTTIAYGKNIHIDYDLYALEGESEAHLVQHFEQNQATGKEASYIPFNRTLHLSSEKNRGTPSHQSFLDVAYVNNYPMSYVMRVSVTVDGEHKPRTVLDKPILVKDSAYVKPDYILENSKELPAVQTGKNLSFELRNEKDESVKVLDIAALRTREGIKGNMLGAIALPDIPKGKEVKVVYSFTSFEEEFVASEDQVITQYIQNNETKDYLVGYNKEIYFRVGEQDASDDRPVIYLKDYIGEYNLKVDVIYGKNEQQVKDTIYWKIDVVNDTVSHRIEQDDHAPYVRKNVAIDFDVNKIVRDVKGDISSRSPFSIALVNALNQTPVELELRGTLRSPNTVALDTEMKIGYQISAVEDYAENPIVKGYIQDANVKGNEVEFNRLFHLTTNQHLLFNGVKQDYVYVENYASAYVVRVFMEDKTGKMHYFMDKQLQLTNDAGKLDNQVDYLLKQEEKKVPSFNYPTKLDVLVQQYDPAGKLVPFKEAQAEEIKYSPLKLNIQSLLRNSDIEGTDITILFDVVSYESYLNPYVNSVIREYTQNKETKTYHVEGNRDIYISTNTRLDRSNDNRESTVYLEDETQHYQLRVEVQKNGKTFMKREFPFKINGIEDDHEAPQDMIGPPSDPNAPISTFLTDPNNSNNPTKRLRITARELNSKDGIGVDLDGFIKKSWKDQEVLLRYDLVALNTYTDYIKGNGVTTTLESDPQAQPDDQQHHLVSSMEEWYGKPSQERFLKRYQTTEYTKDHYEPFTKRFTLRTKLDQATHGQDPSTLFLDNVARDYELTVTATNTTTGEKIKEIIELDITTVKASENSAPVFGSATSVRQPARGSGWFEGEFMPVSWQAASDADNTQTQTEYLYYKVYYYYSTSNNDGSLNAEIQKYMLRYDDMPFGGGILTSEWQVPFPAKIEPAHLRAYACDVNHVCSEPTKSNPFKFNEFGVSEGGGGGSTGGGGIAATIDISPKPTGSWESEDKEVFVNYVGDAELALGAQKAYEITKTSTMPSSFRSTIGNDNRIVVTQEGENYVHVRYTLSDGTELYASSGPYRLHKKEVGDFTMTLVDANGSVVTGWTNQDPLLKISYSGDAAADGVTSEYRIDSYHNEWHKVTAKTTVGIQGERLVFGRVKNKAGTAGPQKELVSKVDKTPIDFRKVVLTEDENGTYEVNVWAEDMLSGIRRLYITENGQQKELEKAQTGTLYKLEGLTLAPTAVTGVDYAGNSSTVTFTNKPTIAFDAPYTLETQAYRDKVRATLTNGVQLSYKMGNQLFSCAGQNPCTVTIERNTLLTGINTDGIKVTNKEVRIQNIDRSNLKLLLNGTRSATDEKKITLDWNYNITNGTLVCYEGSERKEFGVAGTGVTINGKNVLYDCQITGKYAGEAVTSNRVVIYPDETKDIPNDSGSEGIKMDLYVEESRAGTSYFVNTKRTNAKDGYVPLPREPFE